LGNPACDPMPPTMPKWGPVWRVCHWLKYLEKNNSRLIPLTEPEFV